MKTTPLTLIIFSTFTLIACGKKTQVKGVVYSKHNIPIPNVYVAWEEYRESSYPEKTVWEAAKTNENGEYQFSFWGKKRFSYHIKCFCDSGYNNAIVTIGTANKKDLYLK